MTENFAALRVLQQHLLRDEDEPPFVLFGSSFPKDMEYTQVINNRSTSVFIFGILPFFCICRCAEISIKLRYVWKLAELLFC